MNRVGGLVARVFHSFGLATRCDDLRGAVHGDKWGYIRRGRAQRREEAVVTMRKDVREVTETSVVVHSLH